MIIFNKCLQLFAPLKKEVMLFVPLIMEGLIPFGGATAVLAFFASLARLDVFSMLAASDTFVPREFVKANVSFSISGAARKATA